MTDYYLCGIDSAQRCCATGAYINVHCHYSKGINDTYVYYSWLDNKTMASLTLHGWQNAVLLRNPTSDECTMLALVDPLFRKVQTTKMSFEVLRNISHLLEDENISYD